MADTVPALATRKQRFTRKAFAVFAAAGVLSSLGVVLETIVDALIVGNAYGEAGLAVTNVIAPLYMLTNLIGVAMGVGASGRVAKALGKDDPAEARRVFSSALCLTVALGALLSLAGLLFARPLTALLGGGGLGEGCVYYVRCIALGLLPLILLPMLELMLRSDADPKRATLGVAVAAAVNLLLDVVFVCWLRIGVYGAALAMVIGQVAGVLLYLPHFSQPAATLRFVRPKGRECLADAWGSLKSGLGTASYYAWQGGMVVLFNRTLAALYGAGGMAVFNLVVNVSVFSYAISDGIATALPTLAGTYLGEGDYASVRATLRLAKSTALFAALGLAALLLPFAPGLVRLFGVTQPDILQSGARAVRLYALGLLIGCQISVRSAYYQALGYRLMPLLISALRGFLLPVLLLRPMLRLLGAPGAGGAWALAEALSFLLMLLAVRYYKKQKDGDPCLLGKAAERPQEGFEVYLDRDLAQLEPLMQRIEAFCEENSVDARTAYSIQLTVEELATNIAQYGFAAREGMIAVKIAKYEEDIYVRLRDDATNYDPFAASENGDAVDYMGVTLIKKRAKSFVYRRSLVFNNLLIIL